MDWIQVLATILGVGTLDAILRFIFIKQEKKQKEAETHQTTADAENKELETAREANRIVSEQLARSHETITRQAEQINALQEEKAQLLATQSCLFDDMCVHKGCKLRKPHPGQGAKWYNNYREDPNLGADYLSIDTLLKHERASRRKDEQEAGE